MVVDHHVIELYHYQAQKYQTGKIWLFTNIVGVFLIAHICKIGTEHAKVQ